MFHAFSFLESYELTVNERYNHYYVYLFYFHWIFSLETPFNKNEQYNRILITALQTSQGNFWLAHFW